MGGSGLNLDLFNKAQGFGGASKSEQGDFALAPQPFIQKYRRKTKILPLA
jgi:hypothetical protein